MKRVKRVFLYICTGIVISVLIYALSQTVAYDAFLKIQNVVDDSMFVLRNALKGADDRNLERIIIIDIDDRTMRRLGRFNRFWPRKYFGKVISNVKRDGAEIVFLDVLLLEGGHYLDNRALADSLKSAGNVITGFYVSMDSWSKTRRPQDAVRSDRILNIFGGVEEETGAYLRASDISFSYRELIRSSADVGFSNYVPDPDGVLRQFPLYIAYQHWPIPSVPLNIWLKVNGYDHSQSEVTPYGIYIDGTVIPSDRYTFMRINFPIPGSTYQYISFADVMNGTYRPGLFQDKIVMIGSSSPELRDIKRIPGNAKIPGVEVHAAAVATMLDGKFITVLPGHIAALFTLILGITACLFFSHVHPVKIGLPVLLAFPFAMYGICLWGFMEWGRLIVYPVPVCTVAVSYFVITHTYYMIRISHGKIRW